jgi:alanyl-tRNA synthetase
VLNGVTSVYETDVLAGLVERAQSVTGRRIGDDASTDVALRLLADHARTITFLVNDGVLPGNEDRGYVLRRIIRRAVRFAHLLGVEQLVTPPMIGATVELMGDAYPEIRTNQDTITGLVEREEARFRTTLKTGSDLLEAELAGLSEGDVLPAAVAFRLHDTYGFPLDVTREVVAERGVQVDDEGFAGRDGGAAPAGQGGPQGRGHRRVRPGDVPAGPRGLGPDRLHGREESETKAVVVGRPPGPDGTVEVFLDRSPVLRRVGRPGRRHRDHPHRDRASSRSPTPPTPCPGSTATPGVSWTARCSPARRPRPRTTRSAGPPSVATTRHAPACTGRCARSSATTSSSRARTSRPGTSASTSATTRR